MVNILKEKQNWYLTLYSGLAFSPLAVFGGLWGNPFFTEHYHLTTTQAASLTTFIFLGLGIGAPLLGALAARLGRYKKVMGVSLIVSLVCLSILIYAPQLSMVTLSCLLFLFGFGTSAFMLAFALGKERNPLPMAATIIALINTGDAIFGAITEPMIGKFLDLGWHHRVVNHADYFALTDYKHAFIVLPIYLLLACVFLYLVREHNNHVNANA